MKDRYMMPILATVIIMLMSACVCIVLWGRFHRHTVYADNGVDAVARLLDNGVVEWQGKDRSYIGEVFIDEVTTKRLKLISATTHELSEITVRPGCGCTEAKIDKRSLSPGQTAIVTLNYDSSGRRGISHLLLGLTANRSTIAYKMDTELSIVKRPISSYINVPGGKVFFEGIRSVGMRISTDVPTVIAETIDINTLRVLSSSPFLRATFIAQSKRQDRRQDGILRVEALDPPLGSVTGELTIEFKADGKSEKVKIPVMANIQSRYSVTPQMVNINSKTNELALTAELTIVDKFGKNGSPLLETDSRWRHVGKEDSEVDIHRARLEFSPANNDSELYAGKFIIRENELDNSPLVIPVFVTRSNN